MPNRKPTYYDRPKFSARTTPNHLSNHDVLSPEPSNNSEYDDASIPLTPNQPPDKPLKSQSKRSKEVSIFLNNINGFTSKKTSLINIIDQIAPNILCLVETKVIKDKVYEVPNYDNIVKRNIKKGKGGMMVAVRNGTSNSVKDTTTSSNENILSVEVKLHETALRIILCYGPQEDENSDIKQEFYEDVSIEIENATMNNMIPIVLGDLNAKLKYIDSKTVADSGNGEILHEVIEKYGLCVCNFHSKAEGYYTRIASKKSKIEKSVIDYVITTPELFNTMNELHIDEEKVQTPFRTIKKKNTTHAVYSDHCSISVSFPIECEKLNKKGEKRWVFTQKGMDEFTELTTPPFFQVDKSLNVDKNYMMIANKLRELMSKCFEEKKTGCRNILPPVSKEMDKVVKGLKNMKKEGKIQRQIAGEYITKIQKLQLDLVNQQNIKKVRETCQTLSENGKFSNNQFWKLRRSLKKNNCEKSSVIVNGDTELFGESAINNAYKDEFTHRLRNREISPALKAFEQTTEELVSLKLKHAASLKAQPDFVIDELDSIIANLHKGKAPNDDKFTNDLIQATGTGFRQDLLNFYNYLKHMVDIPKLWEDVLITTIYKGKGSKKELVNHRGIFLIATLCKIFERLIKKRINDKLKSVSKLQAGATENRSPNDNLFLLHGTLDHLQYLNKPAFVTLYDFRQAFDSLWLADSINSLWEVGIRDELLPLIHKLNCKASVTVNTPYGKTESFGVDNIVKQGAVLASNICSTSTGEFCKENVGGAPVGSVLIHPLAFVDDIATVNTNIEDTIQLHIRAVVFSMLKRLELNESKCHGLLVNGGIADVFPELYVNGELIDILMAVKYLGDIFNFKNNNDDMMDERERKARVKGVGAGKIDIFKNNSPFNSRNSWLY